MCPVSCCLAYLAGSYYLYPIGISSVFFIQLLALLFNNTVIDPKPIKWLLCPYIKFVGTRSPGLTAMCPVSDVAIVYAVYDIRICQ